VINDPDELERQSAAEANPARAGAGGGGGGVQKHAPPAHGHPAHIFGRLGPHNVEHAAPRGKQRKQLPRFQGFVRVSVPSSLLPSQKL